MSTIGTRTLTAIVSLALLSGGCASNPVASEMASSSPAPSRSPLQSPVASTAPSATSTLKSGPPTLGAGQEPIQAGTYILDLAAGAAAGRKYPRVTITVPDGWENFKGWGVWSRPETPRWKALYFWDVDEVYAHPCKWLGPRIQPGRTVDGLASALASRPLRNATKPVDVTLDGYDGKLLDWSVPADMDLNKCDIDPSNGNHYFESFSAAGWASDRYQQVPLQVDRLWILDVGGERLVVDASWFPGATEEDRAELMEVVRSIRFER